MEPELVAPMSAEENGLQKLQRLVEEVGQSGGWASAPKKTTLSRK